MKKTIYLAILSLTCAAAIAADEAPAQPPAATEPAAKATKAKATPEENLKKWDTDGDGKVSYDEAAKSKSKMSPDKVRSWFDKKDTNKDGFLTLDELSAAKAAK